MIVECRLLILASLCVLQLACTVANAQPPGPPNILFLMTDNQRWDALGSAGNSIIQTPNLDRLAAEGVRFENMFNTTAICAASRASILTGQYRRTHGYTFNTPPLSRQAMAKSYPALLREAGYRTGFIGKFGIETESGAIGDMFDFYSYREAYGTSSPYFRQQPDGTTRHVTRLNGDDAVAFLQSTTPDQPFALSVSFSAPHPEDDNPDQYIYDTAYEDLYQNDTIPPANVSDPVYFDLLPDFIQDSLGRDRWFQRFDTPEKYQRMIKSMYRMITGVDEQVGRIRDELERLALDDNTVVIFTSDNGMMVGEHGLTGIWLGYEPSIRAPLIISDPRLDAARQGSQVDQMALNIDLPATMLELAGVDIPEEVQGSSLQPLLAGEPTPWRTHDAHDVAGDSVSRVLFISGINGATANPNAPVANLVQSAGPVTEFVFDLAGFELGDFNFDSLVDVVDYRILRDHMLGHLEGPVSYSNGDIDKDRDVDLSDFKQFQALFPEVVAAAERVPEPSSMALLSIIATLMLASQRRLDFGRFESYK